MAAARQLDGRPRSAPRGRSPRTRCTGRGSPTARYARPPRTGRDRSAGARSPRSASRGYRSRTGPRRVRGVRVAGEPTRPPRRDPPRSSRRDRPPAAPGSCTSSPACRPAASCRHRTPSRRIPPSNRSVRSRRGRHRGGSGGDRAPRRRRNRSRGAWRGPSCARSPCVGRGARRDRDLLATGTGERGHDRTTGDHLGHRGSVLGRSADVGDRRGAGGHGAGRFVDRLRRRPRSR